MKNLIIFLTALLLLQSCQHTGIVKSRELNLWYDQPAEIWTEALPVGNGRLGAMIFGGTATEQIQLNEESLWTGGAIERANPEALENLDKVRQLLFRGKYTEGEQLAQEKIMGTRLEKGLHTYQTLGDLFIYFDGMGEVRNFKRSLDLRTAVTSVEFEADGVRYLREVFASSPDEVIAVRLSGSAKGCLNFSACLNRPGENEKVSIMGNQLIMQGFAHHEGKGTRFSSVVNIKNRGGNIFATDTSLVVQHADEVEILISGRTDYWGGNEMQPAAADILQADKLKYDVLKKNHISAYQELFQRVDLSLNEQDTLHIPTNRRVERAMKGLEDHHLTELYFQFGRYLLISSSRPDGLPANLQGIWEPDLSPPWNADYHININIQMNYWPALVTNIAECQEPFFDFIDGLRERGAVTAREVYGCRGFVAHHTTDVWKFTDPIGNTGYGMWPLGAAWSSDHFWEHYEYTGDEKFLRERVWPVLKDASLFFADFLVEDPRTGLLVSGPGTSPENKFLTSEGKRASVCMGPAMDHQIIRELFSNTIKASEILGIGKEFTDSLRLLSERLTPSRIGSDGRILEWSEELEEADPGHRHISHLYALYPGDEFVGPDKKWMEASRKSISTRLANGGGHTGWSRAWIINFFARLQDGKKAHENLQALYAKSTHPNLFDNHPPFQIDGNFGATAGIAEMLMQSHHGVIQVLPALPDEWQSGHVTGLRARGGFEVDIYWENGKLSQLRVKSLLGNPCEIKYGDKMVKPVMEEGEVRMFKGRLEEG